MNKRRIAHLVEQGSHGARINRYFDLFIVSLIILSVLAVILETDEDVHERYFTAFHWFEIVSVSVFSIEYLLRLHAAEVTHPSSSAWRSMWKFMRSPFGVIDLLAILPYYLFFFVSFDLRVVTLLRLLRFARLLKMTRYEKSFMLLIKAVKHKKAELLIVGMWVGLILTIASTLIYIVEHETQPDKFPSIGASFYWAISTVTSLGYGDVTPITALGKFVTSVVSVVGIALFALPAGILGSAFVEMSKQQESCPHCGKRLREGHKEHH